MLRIDELRGEFDVVNATTLTGDDAPGNNAPGKNAPGKNAPGNNAPGNDAPGNDAFPRKKGLLTTRNTGAFLAAVQRFWTPLKTLKRREWPEKKGRGSWIPLCEKTSI
ncbi:MAG: hypothetical protein GY822_19175 [Deltaproteobacteria bacterium]|nr:hypothetical protein [Deltaproteobacteria bacterium]